MTGITDLYKVKIKFIPKKFIPELKSLKFYFFGYQELPISHEHIAAKVYNDFKEAVDPLSLAVELIVAARGQLATTVVLGNKELLDFTRNENDINFGK